MSGLVTHWAVPVGIGVICLAAAIILLTIGDRHWPWAILTLIIAAADALLATPVGSWIHQAITWANDAVGSVTGRFTGVVVGFLASAVIATVFVVKLIRKKLDNWTFTTGALTPAALAAIPGPAGAVLMFVVTFPVWLLSQIIAWALSWAR